MKKTTPIFFAFLFLCSCNKVPLSEKIIENDTIARELNITINRGFDHLVTSKDKLLFAGTAYDKIKVSNVELTNGYKKIRASTTNNWATWQGEISLGSGTNTICATVINSSQTQKQKCITIYKFFKQLPSYNHLISPNFSFKNSSCFFYDTKLHIAGGYIPLLSNPDIISNFSYYNSNEKQWDYISPSLPESRHLHQSVVYKDKVYFIGGKSDNGTINTRVYDFKEDFYVWSEVAHIAKSSFTALLYNDKIYTIGGGPTPMDNKVYSYNLNSGDTWVEEAQMELPNGLAGFQAFIVNNSIYILGGYYINKEEIVYSQSCLKFNFDNPSSGWAKLPNLNYPRAFFAAGAINNRYIYALGGVGPEGYTHEANTRYIERYDIATNKWAIIGFTQFITSQSAVCQNNNTIYTVGGNYVDENGKIASNYFFEFIPELN